MTTITYITVDETHRIELMPSGNYYPQYLGQSEWIYWKTGNKQKHFASEKAARKFLAAQENK